MVIRIIEGSLPSLARGAASGAHSPSGKSPCEFQTTPRIKELNVNEVAIQVGAAYVGSITIFALLVSLFN